MSDLDLGRMIYQDVDPTMLMQRIVDETGNLVEQCDGAAIFTPSAGTLRAVCATGISAECVGAAIAAEGSLCGLALSRGEAMHCDDVRFDERVEPMLRAAGERSMLAVPLRRNAEIHALLVIVSRQPAAFDGDTRAAVVRAADAVGVALASLIDTAVVTRDLLSAVDGAVGAASRPGDDERIGEFLANVLAPGSINRLRARRRVGEVLRDARMRSVGQPVVDLESGRLIGIEALARIAELPYRSPDVWIAEAHEVDIGIEFESLAVRCALELLDGLPDGALLTINVSYELLMSGRVDPLLEGRPGERIMLELTEHTAIEDYPRFRQAIAGLRERGVRLAVDDVGAGFSSFRHVIELAPDYIKLDRLFTTGIEHDLARRAMAEALISFARATGIGLVAEGIETEAELQVLRELGIHLGQGFLIARPSREGTLDPAFVQLMRRTRPPGRARAQ